MEYLRGSVNLRAYACATPWWNTAKRELIYKEMELALASRVFEMIDKLTKEGTANATSLAAHDHSHHGHSHAITPVITLTAPNKESGEINRNDPCPCGSGKKWKNCGLKNTAEHQQRMLEKK